MNTHQSNRNIYQSKYTHDPYDSRFSQKNLVSTTEKKSIYEIPENEYHKSPR